MNGKPGDHALTDVLWYHQHHFPPDIEELIWDIHSRDESALYRDTRGWDWFAWELGEQLDEARRFLKERLR